MDEVTLLFLIIKAMYHSFMHTLTELYCFGQSVLSVSNLIVSDMILSLFLLWKDFCNTPHTSPTTPTHTLPFPPPPTHTHTNQSLPTEHARQAFAQVDSNHSGTIPALDFVSLMKTIRGFRMSEYVQDHLLSVSCREHMHEISDSASLANEITSITYTCRVHGNCTNVHVLHGHHLHSI